MRRNIPTDSLETLISDLIFKLGKAHQQIDTLNQRVSKLEGIASERTLTKKRILLKNQ